MSANLRRLRVERSVLTRFNVLRDFPTSVTRYLAVTSTITHSTHMDERLISFQLVSYPTKPVREPQKKLDSNNQILCL